jgi:hypothetical protein
MQLKEEDRNFHIHKSKEMFTHNSKNTRRKEGYRHRHIYEDEVGEDGRRKR